MVNSKEAPSGYIAMKTEYKSELRCKKCDFYGFNWSGDSEDTWCYNIDLIDCNGENREDQETVYFKEEE